MAPTQLTLFDVKHSLADELDRRGDHSGAAALRSCDHFGPSPSWCGLAACILCSRQKAVARNRYLLQQLSFTQIDHPGAVAMMLTIVMADCDTDELRTRAKLLRLIGQRLFQIPNCSRRVLGWHGELEIVPSQEDSDRENIHLHIAIAFRKGFPFSGRNYLGHQNHDKWWEWIAAVSGNRISHVRTVHLGSPEDGPIEKLAGYVVKHSDQALLAGVTLPDGQLIPPSRLLERHQQLSGRPRTWAGGTLAYGAWMGDLNQEDLTGLNQALKGTPPKETRISDLKRSQRKYVPIPVVTAAMRNSLSTDHPS